MRHIRNAPPQGWTTFLQQVYEPLHSAFGHRNWWPAPTAFEIIVGAYLVQNVAWRNVKKAIANLEQAGLLSPAALAAASLPSLEQLVRPSVYYRQKARRLQTFCRYLITNYGGDVAALLGRPTGELRAELLSLPGIGPETADSILCYAAGRPVMVVDAYTRRLFYRLGVFIGPDTPYTDMQRFFETYLPPEPELLNDYHAQIVHLGHAFCRKNQPVCHRCPLADLCPKVGVAADT